MPPQACAYSFWPVQRPAIPIAPVIEDAQNEDEKSSDVFTAAPVGYMNRRWSPDEEARLRKLWGGDLAELAEALNRGERAVHERARLLGLFKRRYS